MILDVTQPFDIYLQADPYGLPESDCYRFLEIALVDSICCVASPPNSNSSNTTLYCTQFYARLFKKKDCSPSIIFPIYGFSLETKQVLEIFSSFPCFYITIKNEEYVLFYLKILGETTYIGGQPY